MHPLFEAYFDRLQMLHQEAEQALADLPAAALDWTPGPEMSSLAVLVTHFTGSEQFRIGDLIGRGATERDRAAEFRVQGLEIATLQQRLATILADSRATLESLTIEDLTSTRFDPSNGQTYNVAWLLAQTLAHTGLHVGHMQMMRQLWEQQGAG